LKCFELLNEKDISEVSWKDVKKRSNNSQNEGVAQLSNSKCNLCENPEDNTSLSDELIEDEPASNPLFSK